MPFIPTTNLQTYSLEILAVHAGDLVEKAIACKLEIYPKCTIYEFEFEGVSNPSSEQIAHLITFLLYL